MPELEIRIGVRQLRGDLTNILRQARQGRRILITSHNAVIAEIGPPPGHSAPPRQPGAMRGQIRMATDFDELPADILDAMEE